MPMPMPMLIVMLLLLTLPLVVAAVVVVVALSRRLLHRGTALHVRVQRCHCRYMYLSTTASASDVQSRCAAGGSQVDRFWDAGLLL